MFIPLLGLDCDRGQTQCTQMNRYCNSKPFKSPNSQAGGDEGGGWWVLSQINCSALSIHLVDIYLFRIVSAVCWIIMFRKHPPGAVYQQNIELNAKKCSVWLFDTLKMKTSCFLWQIIHWYTQTKHSSGLVNVGNIMETFLSKCIFMNNNFLNLNRKSLASHGECLYMERGKFAQFFQRSACNFEYKVPLWLQSD